jgi:hypothetical protein
VESSKTVAEKPLLKETCSRYDVAVDDVSDVSVSTVGWFAAPLAGDSWTGAGGGVAPGAVAKDQGDENGPDPAEFFALTRQ